MKNVEYQVTELTTQLIQKSEAMWAYASYEPKQEIEEAGIHYTLTSLSKNPLFFNCFSKSMRCVCIRQICITFRPDIILQLGIVPLKKEDSEDTQ